MISKGIEAQFIWGQWTVPVIVNELGADWAVIRYPLEEPIGPGIYIDLQLLCDYFSATYYYFTINVPKQFNDLLYLRRAGSRTYVERRQSWRVTLNEPVRMEYGENRIGFEGTLIDLSSTGAYVAVEHVLPVISPVRIYLPIYRSIYAINGVVVRKIPPNLKLGVPMRLGIRFVNNPIELRNVLVQYLWSRIRKMYRNEFIELYPNSDKRPKKPKNTINPPVENGDNSGGNVPRNEGG
ncbi:MAG TPA: PilZ domain-containing protein [Candidatus Hydrogenedens sp.]|nr:PilZ domain-containing protein [Candidatus Hydrogenedens sp.]HOK09452.1 PilZ domain-containing protein [Candidatus Hydrogenedens sp.]HOL18957.1 PilZ domain-containing protein [Candidatus Hydrogenedens sp.]HPP58991.1 PilZ domain-containing protein [Candidatus Hydrogenedens sp.]